METLKDNAKALIKEMRLTKVEDDDDFIAFVDRYQSMRQQLSTYNDDEIKSLIAALDKAYERLSQQMSFCTLGD